MNDDDGARGGRFGGRGFPMGSPGEGRGGGFARGPRGGGGRGAGGRFGGMGGRRRRLFDPGELQVVLLKLIGETPRHGYELIRAIEQLTGGSYAPSPGIVYPTLTLLAELRLVSERSEESGRKLFTITVEGSEYLAARAQAADASIAKLAALADQAERTDPAPIRRAMHNLRNVLLHKLDGGCAAEQLHAAVALIDETAQKIERL